MKLKNRWVSCAWVVLVSLPLSVVADMFDTTTESAPLPFTHIET